MKFKRVSIFTLSAMVALLSGSVFAKSYSTPESKALLVADGKIGQRICYYEDKAYTAGAVIKVDDVLLVCSDENDYETNGSLKWVVLKQKK
ncbi:YnjH family protein [Vibrio parahaemolyticus]|uniref:YnjH family protein n=1 Tax=Vibrio parahaemolyticus TaxID=670 RepID=UPI0015BF16D8|nr:YnjH family protein [Vibrio parahaemolyticus]MBE4323803.1 YnjH family protein [Vibrio parahaemolyticus]QLE24173.1 DUF1496 domain-containing protein [Vibrio parahaemolyticus]HCE1878052.1 YnjH family protein [Vibrio parahaemolyticus]HCE1882871.1 YnjH family protein [Vibrio parahaemolyticus]HCE3643260.1 YnjH family protein [Vibrio parahaemolyticus]